MFLCTETLEDHSQLHLKGLEFGRLQAFLMYGGLGMSGPSLHRESTDSLISLRNMGVCIIAGLYLLHTDLQMVRQV